MRLVNPPDLPRPAGFSQVSVAGPGQLVTVAGQVGQRGDGSFDDDLVEQFRVAAGNVATALSAVGALPANVISILIFTTDIGGYRRSLTPIGEAYRSVFGNHYPPMALLGVNELFDPAVKVELVATAFLEQDSIEQAD